MTCMNLWYSYLAQTTLVEENCAIVHGSVNCGCKDRRIYHACLLETQDHSLYFSRELLYYYCIIEIILTSILKPPENEICISSLAGLFYG